MSGNVKLFCVVVTMFIYLKALCAVLEASGLIEIYLITLNALFRNSIISSTLFSRELLSGKQLTMFIQRNSSILMLLGDCKMASVEILLRILKFSQNFVWMFNTINIFFFIILIIFSLILSSVHIFSCGDCFIDEFMTADY